MRYVLGVLGFILMAFLVVALVFGRGGNQNTAQNTNAVAKLVDYSDKNSNVSQTIIGKMVGEEERRAVRIIVTPNERRLEVLSGYDETVISSQSYPNTQSAYSNFLSALGGLGFLTKKDSKISDPRAACPAGNRYVYDLSENGSHVSNLWSTSCGNQGTFAGRGPSIRELFQRQIPDYSKQVQSIRL